MPSASPQKQIRTQKVLSTALAATDDAVHLLATGDAAVRFMSCGSLFLTLFLMSPVYEAGLVGIDSSDNNGTICLNFFTLGLTFVLVSILSDVGIALLVFIIDSPSVFRDCRAICELPKGLPCGLLGVSSPEFFFWR